MGLPDQISVTWHFRDVQEACSGLTDDEARAVLQWVEKYYDANHGISWDTLAAAADYILSSGLPPSVEPK